MENEIVDAVKVIPIITEPLGKHWEQPALSEIKISEQFAIMSLETMNKLLNYSHSTPSGVYEGKIWRSQYIENGKELNYLHWWSKSEKPNHCKHNIRKIILA